MEESQIRTSKESTIESQETEPDAIPVSEDEGSVNEGSEAFAESDVVETETVQGNESEQGAYTRLGKVTDKSKKEMADLLGNGDVTVTFMIDK